MSYFRDVCHVGDIPEGESRLRIVNGTRLGIFHIGGTFFALDDHCPHAGASLAMGYIEGDIVSCRIHHWRFCIRDGKYVDERKPDFDVRSYPVRVVGDQVQVCLETATSEA